MDVAVDWVAIVNSLLRSQATASAASTLDVLKETLIKRMRQKFAVGVMASAVVHNAMQRLSSAAYCSHCIQHMQCATQF